MKGQNLEEILGALRSEQPQPEMVREAARRVFRNVFDAAYIPESVQRIRGCADFQKLIPSYLDRSLSVSRMSLVEDHLRTCVDCRRVFREISGSEPVKLPGPKPFRRSPVLAWALAASLTVGVAVGVTGAFKGLLPGQHAVRATVVSVEGSLYRMNEFGSSLLEAGAVIRNAEELRTAKGSRAIFRLMNGAQVEMGERSDVSVSRGWSGTSVDVESGRVIVQSALRPASFTVAAGDVRVPVRDAVFAVNRGTKGSRIAVAKGSAQVEESGRSVRVNAGQQFASDYRLTNASLQSEFEWSKNSSYYLGLLQDFSTLQKQWHSIPAPGLRYSSKLVKYLPANTVIYAAIPNLGGTITEAKRMFDERLAESATLRKWWEQQPMSRGGELEKTLTQISAVSQYLGDEIVLAVPATTSNQYGQPVFLAEVRQPGLREYMAQTILGNQSGDAKSLPLYVDDHVVVASPNADQLKAVTGLIAASGSSPFLETPFYKRIAQSYAAGAGYLVAADMEQVAAKSVTTPKEIPTGFSNVQYLVFERRDVAGDTQTRASLSFAGRREGIASWLGAPSAMRSLDFVSPDAYFAASVVMKNPQTVMKELLQYVTKGDERSMQEFSEMQDQLGIKLVDDLAATLGGDATVAIDGPLVPIPSWKIAIEVYDPARLGQTISTLAQKFNERSSSQTGKLQLASELIDGRTFNSVRSDKMPDLAAYYTFVDGYLLAAPTKGALLQAIQNRETGYTLATSEAFQSQLPADSFTDFSAVVWHNAGKSIAALSDQLKSAVPSQTSKGLSLATLLAHSGPGLVCVYGEPDRIVAATKGEFMGFNFGALAGIEQGRSVPFLIASARE